MPKDSWEAAAEQYRAQVHTGAVAGGNAPVGYAQGFSKPPNGGQVTDIDNPEPNDADWRVWQAQDAPPERFSTELLKEIPYAAGQAGLGALKGAGSTLDAIGHIAYPDWLEKRLTGKVAPDHAFDATNPFQSAGKGAEQAAEFLIPGLGEEDAVSAGTKLLPFGEKVAKPLSRIAYNAITSGLINKEQGGGFVNGAAAGGAGSAVSDAAHAFAPHLIEFGQSLHTPGARTGRAVLDETRGVFPGAIRRSARETVNNINSEMEGAVKAAPGLVPLAPAQAVANANIQKAFGRNEPKMYSGAKRLARIVTNDLNGAALPSAVPAWDALELRRGVDTALPPGSFNPASTNAFKGYRTPLRDALNESIGNAVPEYRPLATRESNLIPATKPAKRGFGHLWGPGAGAIFGGYYGARAGARNDGGLTGAVQGGLTGAAEGAAAGTILPAFINSSARAFNSPVLRRVVVPFAEGSGLQMARKPSR